MRNFRPLQGMSNGALEPVLFLDASAPTRQLLEAANYRMSVVRELADLLSTCRTGAGSDADVANATAALVVLIDDANALYDAATASLASHPKG